MPELYDGPDRRRSPRLTWDVGLIVRGESFSEKTFTISINQHGALLLLEAKVVIGQKIFLWNPLTTNEVESKVVRFGSEYAGLAQVAVEFLVPSTEFWPFSAMSGEST